MACGPCNKCKMNTDAVSAVETFITRSLMVEYFSGSFELENLQHIPEYLSYVVRDRDCIGDKQLSSQIRILKCLGLHWKYYVHYNEYISSTYTSPVLI